MQQTNEQLINVIEEEFKLGHKLIRINGSSEIVKLGEIDKTWLPYIHEEVHLLSPYLKQERTLLYMFTEELISILPQLKEEEIIQEDVLQVVETLLLGLDYMTHERFISHPFEDRHREKLLSILSELFSKEKSYSFSEFAKRPSLNKSNIYQNEEGIYAKDEREERKRIYMAIVYKKSKNTMEHFKHVAHHLMQINLKPNTTNVSYEDALKGMTEHELYSDTIFYLNMVLRTFSWFMNSASWQNNELFRFDEFDLRSKLGLR